MGKKKNKDTKKRNGAKSLFLGIKNYPNKIKKDFRSAKVYFSFLRENGLTNRLLFFTLIYRILSGFLGVIGIGLFLPLIKGMISQDFDFLTKSEAYLFISEYVPFIVELSYLQVFFLLAFLIFFAIVLKTLCNYYGDLFLSAQRLRIGSNVNRYIFNNYLRLGKPFYDGVDGSEESVFFVRFSKMIQKLLEGCDNIVITIQFFSISIIMIFISWELYLLSLFLLPLVIFLQRKMRKRMKESMELEMESDMGFPAIVNNSFLRLPLTFQNSKESFEGRRFSVACKDYEHKKYELGKNKSLMGPFNEFLMLFVLLLFSLVLGFLSYTSSIDVARGLVFFYSFKTFIGLGQKIIRAYLALTLPTKQISKAFKKIEQFDEFRVSSGKRGFRGLKEKIVFSSLNFSYPGKKNKILKNLNFQIKKGKITSIIGRSGSGKSTLVNLLLRLYDCPKGSIFIDGVDIREYSSKSIRNHISFVSQETILFKDTLYNNLVYGVKKRVSKKKVADILVSVGLRDLISENSGVDKMVSRGGKALSGGEKQRIGLARALLNDAEILILDEPTSSLDALTESEIKKVVDKFTKGKTVIIIAHRLNTIKGSYKVAVMEGGRIVEKGNIAKLLRKNRRFKKYWDSQSLN